MAAGARTGPSGPRPPAKSRGAVRHQGDVRIGHERPATGVSLHGRRDRGRELPGTTGACVVGIAEGSELAASTLDGRSDDLPADEADGTQRNREETARQLPRLHVEPALLFFLDAQSAGL